MKNMKYQEDGGMFEGFYFTKFVEKESASEDQTLNSKSKNHEDEDNEDAEDAEDDII